MKTTKLVTSFSVCCFLWGGAFSQITTTQAPVLPLPKDMCALVGGYLNNPYWIPKPGKLYTECPDIKVGIGTTSPTHGLHVIRNVRFQSTLFVAAGVGIGAESESFSSFYIKNKHQGAAIHIDQSENLSDYSKLLFFEYSNPLTEILKVYNPTTGKTPFLFQANGTMLVNNGTKDIFKLTTNGLLRTREIILDAQQPWPDYVFEENYKLPSLYEVKQFVALNKHLPDVPSAAEIMETGIPLAEMNKILLEKVEQLTLYLIEQQEQITALEERLNGLTK